MVIMGKSEESVLVVVRCRPLSSKEVNQELESGSAAKEDKDEDKHRGNGGFYSGEQNTEYKRYNDHCFYNY